MAYAIVRTAKRNPSITGSTLYLTKNGLWSLDAADAQTFRTESGADDYAHMAFEPGFARTVEIVS